MIYTTTEIDTVALQVPYNNSQIQRDTHTEILYILSANSFVIKRYKNNRGNGNTTLEYKVMYGGAVIVSINTGAYRVRSGITNKLELEYYIKLKFAGLKSYNYIQDELSFYCLSVICAYLNTRCIYFNFTELDICIDISSPFNNILAVCTKRSPKTQYYGVLDNQTYATTTYIEDIPYNNLNKAVLRAYTYDKAIKENLPYNLTRFELKLQTKFFNMHSFSHDAIARALDRYTVMYFPTIDAKNQMIDQYINYDRVTQREIKKLQFQNYRLYPNIHVIHDFISYLQQVNELMLYQVII